eukprot:SAG31_NODE_12746_length_919_cov_3.550000_1_plen_60_part_00
MYPDAEYPGTAVPEYFGQTQNLNLDLNLVARSRILNLDRGGAFIVPDALNLILFGTPDR